MIMSTQNVQQVMITSVFHHKLVIKKDYSLTAYFFLFFLLYRCCFVLGHSLLMIVLAMNNGRPSNRAQYVEPTGTISNRPKKDHWQGNYMTACKPCITSTYKHCMPENSSYSHEIDLMLLFTHCSYYIRPISLDYYLQHVHVRFTVLYLNLPLMK